MNKPFYFCFAKEICQVTGEPVWWDFFSKYFNGTSVTLHQTIPINNTVIASLKIVNIENKKKSSFTFSHTGLNFRIEITGRYHFYYPVFNNVLQVIYTHLFYRHDGFVFHGSAVEHKKHAYIFLGKSGYGKTTIARNSEIIFHKTVLADNHVFLKRKKNKFILYPFPFDSFHVSATHPLVVQRTFILQKSSRTRIVTAVFRKRLQYLRQHAQIQIGQGESDYGSGSFSKSLFSFMNNVNIEILYLTKSANLWQIVDKR
jgi:hypothetical protein